MICPICGAHLDEDALFCSVCGNRIHTDDIQVKTRPAASEEPGSTDQTEPPESMTTGAESANKAALNVESSPIVKEQKKVIPQKESSVPRENEKVMKWKLLRLGVGTLFIVLGIIQAASAGTSISSTSFGGDFYTYTYQGIVAVAEGLAAIERSLGMILAAIGAAIDLQVINS